MDSNLNRAIRRLYPPSADRLELQLTNMHEMNQKMMADSKRDREILKRLEVRIESSEKTSEISSLIQQQNQQILEELRSIKTRQQKQDGVIEKMTLYMKNQQVQLDSSAEVQSLFRESLSLLQDTFNTIGRDAEPRGNALGNERGAHSSGHQAGELRVAMDSGIFGSPDGARTRNGHDPLAQRPPQPSEVQMGQPDLSSVSAGYFPPDPGHQSHMAGVPQDMSPLIPGNPPMFASTPVRGVPAHVPVGRPGFLPSPATLYQGPVGEDSGCFSEGVSCLVSIERQDVNFTFVAVDASDDTHTVVECALQADMLIRRECGGSVLRWNVHPYDMSPFGIALEFQTSEASMAFEQHFENCVSEI